MFLEEKSLLVSQHEQNMNCVLNLQTITEKLLFSMNIPQEIATKYNFLKQQTYESLGLQYAPGVITYVPQPSTLQTDVTTNAPYSSTNYMSTGGVKRQTSNQNENNSQQQLFTQLEELLRSLTDHLSNMTKGIILEEDNSFLQESISKKFLEPLTSSTATSPKDQHYHYTQLPREFLQRVDNIKCEFDGQIKKLIEHFNQQREEQTVQNDRKIELLKQENAKYKVELQSSKQVRDRQDCMCKFYEENLQQMRDEHNKYVTKLKQKYENEIYEIRTNIKNSGMSLDQFRDKIFTDMKNRIFQFVQEKNTNYINAFCQDQGGVNQSQIDPIELLFYIIQRMEGDNNWLVDKLAETEEEKRRLQEKSQIDMQEEEILNGQLFADLIQQTKISDEILENFAFHHDELKASLETGNSGSGSSSQNHQLPLQQRQEHFNNGKENNTINVNASQTSLKRHNFPSAANLRESLQSTNRSNNQNLAAIQTPSSATTANMLSKSQSGKNLNLKHQQIMMKNGNSSTSHIDDESAILGGTLNAMHLQKDQENFNSHNNNYKQQTFQQINSMYNSIESNQSHRVMLSESTDYYNN